MDCSIPGLPVHHQLLELTQTHVHWVSDGIQPSHPLLSPSPPAFNLSQHQGLFKWVSSLYQVAKVLAFQHQHQSFQWISIGVFKFSENLKGSESFRIKEKQSILSVSSHHRFLLWSWAGQCSVLSTCLWLRSSSKSCRSQRTRWDLVSPRLGETPGLGRAFWAAPGELRGDACQLLTTRELCVCHISWKKGVHCCLDYKGETISVLETAWSSICVSKEITLLQSSGRKEAWGKFS